MAALLRACSLLAQRVLDDYRIICLGIQQLELVGWSSSLQGCLSQGIALITHRLPFYPFASTGALRKIAERQTDGQMECRGVLD